MKIELEISEQNEATDSPWWILIDPNSIREFMKGVAQSGEIPDDDRILTTIAFSVEGPFFSRQEAEDYLKRRRYDYSDGAKVWCSSGYRSTQYRMAIKKARVAAETDLNLSAEVKKLKAKIEKVKPALKIAFDDTNDLYYMNVLSDLEDKP